MVLVLMVKHYLEGRYSNRNMDRCSDFAFPDSQRVRRVSIAEAMIVPLMMIDD